MNKFFSLTLIIIFLFGNLFAQKTIDESNKYSCSVGKKNIGNAFAIWVEFKAKGSFSGVLSGEVKYFSSSGKELKPFYCSQELYENVSANDPKCGIIVFNDASKNEIIIGEEKIQISDIPDYIQKSNELELYLVFFKVNIFKKELSKAKDYYDNFILKSLGDIKRVPANTYLFDEAQGDSAVYFGGESFVNRIFAEKKYSDSYYNGNRTPDFLDKLSKNYLKLAEYKFPEALKDTTATGINKFDIVIQYYEASFDKNVFSNYESIYKSFTDAQKFQYGYSFFAILENKYLNDTGKVDFSKPKSILKSVSDSSILFCQKNLYLGHICYYEESDSDAESYYLKVINNESCSKEKDIAIKSLEQLKQYKK